MLGMFSTNFGGNCVETVLVSMATMCELGSRCCDIAMESSIRGRFPVLQNVHTGPVAHLAFCSIRPRALYAGLKRLWHEADHLTSIQCRG